MRHFKSAPMHRIWFKYLSPTPQYWITRLFKKDLVQKFSYLLLTIDENFGYISHKLMLFLRYICLVLNIVTWCKALASVKHGGSYGITEGLRPKGVRVSLNHLLINGEVADCDTILPFHLQVVVTYNCMTHWVQSI